MKQGRTLTELAKEIERQRDTKVDLVASTEHMAMTSEPEGIRLVVGDDRWFDINTIGHNQIAAHTGIPAAYYKRMEAEAPALLASNVNNWFIQAPAKRMTRTLDGRVRAFLSDSYRPLENYDLAEAVLPILMDLKMEIMSCEITESRLYLKAVDERIKADIPKNHHMGDGTHTVFDTCSPAIIISNSEVGMGSLSIATGIFTKVCTNLAAISDAGMKKRHVGAKTQLDDGENVRHLLTDETKKATDKAVWMQVRDVVQGAFNEAKFNTHIDKLKGLTEQKIIGDPVKVVELSSKRLGITETESKSVLRHLIEGGDLSRYGLFNSITRAAQDNDSYDRASEIERIGGVVLELPRHDWDEVQKLAA